MPRKAASPKFILHITCPTHNQVTQIAGTVQRILRLECGCWLEYGDQNNGTWEKLPDQPPRYAKTPAGTIVLKVKCPEHNQEAAITQATDKTMTLECGCVWNYLAGNRAWWSKQAAPATPQS